MDCPVIGGFVTVLRKRNGAQQMIHLKIKNSSPTTIIDSAHLAKLAILSLKK
jgi:hypothetical protein